MPSNYYFLEASLPELSFDSPPPPIEWTAIAEEISAGVSDKDRGLLRFFRNIYDNRNLLSLIGKGDYPFSDKGNYTKDELAYEYENIDTVPHYMRRFMEAFRTRTPIYFNMLWDDQLSWLYFEEAETLENSFLKKWLHFEQGLRNLLTAINCRDFGIPIEKRFEVRIEQPGSQNIICCRDEISEAIRESKASDFSLTSFVSWAGDILSLRRENLEDFELGIDRLRWKKLDELTEEREFKIDRLIAFLIRLDTLERWEGLKKKDPAAVLDSIIGKTEEIYYEAKGAAN